MSKNVKSNIAAFCFGYSVIGTAAVGVLYGHISTGQAYIALVLFLVFVACCFSLITEEQ